MNVLQLKALRTETLHFNIKIKEIPYFYSLRQGCKFISNGRLKAERTHLGAVVCLSWALEMNENNIYLLEVVKSSVCPFFRHVTVGSGDPLGGPHSSSTVSPRATRVFCGSKRNSSRRTARKERKMFELEKMSIVEMKMKIAKHSNRGGGGKKQREISGLIKRKMENG